MDLSNIKKKIMQSLTIPTPVQIKEKKKEERLFQIPDSYFKEENFISTLKNNLKYLKEKPFTPLEKLEKAIEISINSAKEHKKNKEKEKKKKWLNLKKKLRKEKSSGKAADLMYRGSRFNSHLFKVFQSRWQ